MKEGKGQGILWTSCGSDDGGGVWKDVCVCEVVSQRTYRQRGP